MAEPLFVVGLVVALFVGYNIGGATTGPAFGPAVGAGVLSKLAAAALMSVCFFAGAWTLGRRVVATLGEELLTGGAAFTLESAIVVLFFIGGALLVGNVAGVPASTSMTAVGAIAGLGVATGSLAWDVMGEIVVWWLVAPIMGFWASGVIGRYLYPTINRLVAIEQTEGALLELDRSGVIPRPRSGPQTGRRELVGSIAVIAIGCLMAFSSGTSNIANAIAPLYGAGSTGMTPLILAGCVAVAAGAFTIARRTLDTLGNEVTDLPLPAALVVAVISSAIVIALSAIGVPASFVVVATMSIVGLGWGRATRTATVADRVTGEAETEVTVGALAATEAGEEVPEMGEEDPEEVPDAAELFDPETTGRVILLQNVVPVLATVGAFLTVMILLATVW